MYFIHTVGDTINYVNDLEDTLPTFLTIVKYDKDEIGLPLYLFYHEHYTDRSFK